MTASLIEELPIPERVGAAGWDDFVAAVESMQRSDLVWAGSPDGFYTPEEELPHFQDPNRPTRLFVARDEQGAVVASGHFELQADELETAWLLLQVPPEAEGRGIGRALADALEMAVAQEGRRKIIAYVPEADFGGERLASPTGVGSVPARSRSTRFAQARGYELKQVNRYSRIAFPVPGVREQLAAAIERSGPDFTLHSWTGRTPERWLEDVALLATRMSTDAPDADVGTPEDVWTAERLAAEDARKERDDPRRFVTTAVEHVPTGRLVGFTEYSVPPQQDRAVSQYATLVLREHRGHKLGMLLKIANLAYLEEVSPGHPSATTWNAEENRPMLDVNEAIGFVGVAFEGIWVTQL